MTRVTSPPETKNPIQVVERMLKLLDVLATVHSESGGVLLAGYESDHRAGVSLGRRG